jgi:hypothetical protein
MLWEIQGGYAAWSKPSPIHKGKCRKSRIGLCFANLMSGGNACAATECKSAWSKSNGKCFFLVIFN